MQEFFVSFASWFSSLFDLLGAHTFRIFGFNVTYLSLIVALIITSFAITVFWRGARG